MKSDGPLKHFILAFVLAVICYALFYNRIEHRRIRKGPWVVAFTNSIEGWPQLVIDQPKLTITNVQINFPEEAPLAAQKQGMMLFNQPRPVPYDVPFGQCVFMDTTFLPGTVTFKMYGHEIELLPRVLIIDHQERPWLPSNAITLHPIQPEQNRNDLSNAPSEESGHRTVTTPH
jgi:hypothetical protein